MKGFRDYLRHLRLSYRRHTKHFVVILILLAVHEGVNVVLPYCGGLAIDAGLRAIDTPLDPWLAIKPHIQVITGLLLFRLLGLSFFRDWYRARYIDHTIPREQKLRALRNYFLSENFSTSENPIKILETETRGVEALTGVTDHFVFKITPVVLQSIFIGASLLWRSLELGVIFVTCFAIFACVVVCHNRVLGKRRTELESMQVDQKEVKTDLYLKTSTGKEERAAAIERWHERQRAYDKERIRLDIWEAVFNKMRTLPMRMCEVAVLATGIAMVCQNLITVGTLTASLELTRKAVSAVTKLGTRQTVIAKLWPRVTRLLELTDQTQETTGGS